MEVASQHCDTVPNKTKNILDTVNIEKIFIHDRQVQYPVQSSVRGTRTFILSLGQLRSIEKFRTIVETVEIRRFGTLKAKCRMGWMDWKNGYPILL